jgi:hypothetical protein
MTNTTLSDQAIQNCNKLLKLLKDRLRSSGKATAIDLHGNTVYIDCDIYSADMLISFITLSVCDFNQTPHFTFYTLEDTKFVDSFTEVLVEGATVYALASQALIERGREFQMLDSGVSFTPPSIAEMLNTQFSTLLAHHFEKLKLIKSAIFDFSL